MTSAPACPRAIAAAWPMPELAPVTSAFWPARTFAMVRSGAPVGTPMSRRELRMNDLPLICGTHPRARHLRGGAGADDHEIVGLHDVLSCGLLRAKNHKCAAWSSRSDY